MYVIIPVALDDSGGAEVRVLPLSERMMRMYIIIYIYTNYNFVHVVLLLVIYICIITVKLKGCIL